MCTAGYCVIFFALNANVFELLPVTATCLVACSWLFDSSNSLDINNHKAAFIVCDSKQNSEHLLLHVFD